MPKILAAGGLGNQLFYWNVAHHLVLKHNCKVSIIYSKKDTSRKNELDFLKDFCLHDIKIEYIEWPFAWVRLISRINRRMGKTAGILTKLSRLYSTVLPGDTFDCYQRKPWLIQGYFQNPIFVVDNLNSYIDELLDSTSKTLNHKLESQLPSQRTSLHIRRGDFVHNAASVGLLTLEYFSKISEKDEDVIICTDSHSDDPFMLSKFPTAKIVGSDTASTWETFSVLSNSQKLIASNSTFSWWAGLLALRRGGVVFVPHPWTKTDVYGDNYLESDLFTRVQAEFEQSTGEII